MRSARLSILAMAVAAALPAARASAPDNAAGYLLSSNGRPVVDSAGGCWHTREWHAGMRFANCEPKLAAAAAVPAAAAAPVRKPAAQAARPAPASAAPLRLSADSLFRFDSAALSESGRAALDTLANRVAAARYASVKIAGHADPLGTPSYNRALSERRAEAVRDYLVERGIDAGRVRTEGLGSAQAVKTLAQCEGMPRTRLIECLQPDRYAEVTIAGAIRSASAQ